MKILETFSGLSYEVTQEQADNIMYQSTTGNAKGIQIGNDYVSFASIKSISDSNDYHQPYTPTPKGIGFTGVVALAKRKSALEALARGLKKAKAKLEAQGQTTKNIDALLDIARKRYATIKS